MLKEATLFMVICAYVTASDPPTGCKALTAPTGGSMACTNGRKDKSVCTFACDVVSTDHPAITRTLNGSTSRTCTKPTRQEWEAHELAKGGPWEFSGIATECVMSACYACGAKSIGAVIANGKTTCENTDTGDIRTCTTGNGGQTETCTNEATLGKSCTCNSTCDAGSIMIGNPTKTCTPPSSMVPTGTDSTGNSAWQQAGYTTGAEEMAMWSLYISHRDLFGLNVQLRDQAPEVEKECAEDCKVNADTCASTQNCRRLASMKSTPQMVLTMANHKLEKEKALRCFFPSIGTPGFELSTRPVDYDPALFGVAPYYSPESIAAIGEKLEAAQNLSETETAAGRLPEAAFAEIDAKELKKQMDFMISETSRTSTLYAPFQAKYPNSPDSNTRLSMPCTLFNPNSCTDEKCTATNFTTTEIFDWSAATYSCPPLCHQGQPPGQYNFTSAFQFVPTYCSQCPQNQYQSSSTVCTACPENSGSPVKDHSMDAKSKCVAHAGYSGADGDAAIACPVDTFKASTGKAPCTACPKNSKTGDAKGSTACQANAGYTGADGDAPVACAAGSFKDKTGSSKCTACAAGKTSTSSSTSCIDKPPSVKLADASGTQDGDYPWIEYDGIFRPICGHHFWDDNIGANKFCQLAGYSSGTGTQTRVSFSVDAVVVGRCNPGEELNACTAGGNAWNNLNYKSDTDNGWCNSGKGIGFSVQCGGPFIRAKPDQQAQEYERAVNNGTANFSSTKASGCPTFTAKVTGTGEVDTKVLNLGEDCWTESLGCRENPCAFCGAGLCCREDGRSNQAGCPEGNGGSAGHVCTAVARGMIMLAAVAESAKVEMTLAGGDLWDWVNNNREQFKTALITDIAATLSATGISKDKISDVTAALVASLLLKAAPSRLLAEQSMDVSFIIKPADGWVSANKPVNNPADKPTDKPTDNPASASNSVSASASDSGSGSDDTAASGSNAWWIILLVLFILALAGGLALFLANKKGTVAPVHDHDTLKKENDRDVLKKAFDHFDSDNSGSLDKQEFRTVMTMSSQTALTDAEFETVFSAVDTDESGVISFDEFYAWSQSRAESLPVTGH